MYRVQLVTTATKRHLGATRIIRLKMSLQKREKKRHESVLTEEVVKVVQYLNQFLPPHHSIKYIGFDMARVSKK